LEKNGWENGEFRAKGWRVPGISSIELRSKAIPILIDRLPAVRGEDARRGAKRPSFPPRPRKKKKKEKRGRKKGGKKEKEDVGGAAEKSGVRINEAEREQRGEPAGLPQFHAIESAWTKLKTNRFPAPCWHALRLRDLCHVSDWM